MLARNPLFPNKVTRYELDPAVVDVVEFCSKDYAPILPRLHEITERFNTHFNYTITAYGIGSSGCMTLQMLGKANGIEFRNLKHKGTRQGCGCFESRDIGAYDSCPNGCRYCYANKSPEKARENYRTLHDPDSPMLLGHLKETDTLTQGVQRSLLRK